MSKFARIAALAIMGYVSHASADASDYKRDIRGLKATVLGLKGAGSGTGTSASGLFARIDSLASNRNDLTVRREGEDVRVSMAGDVLFDFDKADIRAAAESTLQEIARLIASIADGRTVIEGHTDSKGAVAYNQALSERRAKAVMAWLEAHGIDKSKLAVAGMGSRHPVAPNKDENGLDNPEGRALNRRVEFVFPKTK
jgi:outer membrane protein OmpA-like peptidoglycan-associated protein